MMNLLVLGYHVFPPKLEDHELNANTWNALGQYFGRVDLVVQSSDQNFHKSKSGNIHLYESPRTKFRSLNLFLYIITAFLVGIWNLLRGTRLILCSEIVIAGPIGVLLSKIGLAELIAEVQGEVLSLTSNSYPLEGVIRSVSKWVCLRAARIRVVSSKIYQTAVKLGIPPRKICLIRNKVDTRIFHPRNKEIGQIGYNRNFTFLAIGSLVKVKAFDILIKSFSIVRNKLPNAVLFIAGDGPEKKNLENIARVCGVEDSVRFLGYIRHSELPLYFNQSDVFVLSSLSEGMPRVVLEAMASGVPVIATAVGGVPEIIKHGETGLLVHVNDSESLAKAMIELSRNPELARTIARAALKLIHSYYHWDKTILRQARFILGTYGN